VRAAGPRPAFDPVAASMVLPATTRSRRTGLDAESAADGPEDIEAYMHLPNFLIVAVRRAT
jgi:hypothetical protein